MFTKISRFTSNMMGSPLALFISLALTGAWFVSGFFLSFSTAWQMVANTTTTIFTFLMVFLIQASQNQDTRALHVKIDELIKSHDSADNAFIGAEQMSKTDVLDLAQQHEDLV
jgi:low affinity Fe/Cu permease